MDWLYVWSPRYRFFHEFLSATTKDLSGFHMQPIFAEQHLFTPLQSDKHFLTGIPIKIHVIITYIQRNMGKYFFFTDVDIIVLPEFTLQDLEAYKQYDITSMQELHTTIKHNIGCLLIRCCPETLEFFQRVEQRIRSEKLLDQDAFHLEVSTFPGRMGTFSSSEFLQSNMLSEDSQTYKIIQCLTSESNPTEVLIEKILTIASAYDVTPFLPYLPTDVQEVLRAEGWMS